jgi:UDP-N-acetylglucosamine:LPS N-acetylglucosamine transferase
MTRCDTAEVPAEQRVLILYSRAGGGHLSVAVALAAALGSIEGMRINAQLADIYVDHSRYPVSLFPAMYSWMLRNQPRLWGLLFNTTNHFGQRLHTEALRPFVLPGLQRLLDVTRPHLVISVLPVINSLLAIAVRTCVSMPRFEIVVTDWCDIHRSWVTEKADYYSVPTNEARADCIRYQSNPARIDVAGYPVRPEFEMRAATGVRHRVLTSMGLDPERFTLLFMVGADGSPRALQHLGELVQVDLPLQVIVICGRHELLRRKLAEVPSRVELRALAYVGNVADLMHSSDLLVTKAGGASLAEAFTSALPVIVNDLVPGQETGNRDLLVRKGAIEYAPTPALLASTIRRLIEYPALRTDLASRGRLMTKPNAASGISSRMVLRLQVAASEAARLAL